MYRRILQLSGEASWKVVRMRFQNGRYQNCLLKMSHLGSFQIVITNKFLVTKLLVNKFKISKLLFTKTQISTILPYCLLINKSSDRSMEV